MDKRERGDREDDVKISFGPLKIWASGKTTTLVLIALVGCGLIFWHDYKTGEQSAEMIEWQHTVAYVLTLTEQERKALRLRMPEKMRLQMNTRDGGNP